MTSQPKPKKKPSNLAVRFMTAGVAVPILLWLLYGAPPIGVVVLVLSAVTICAAELFAMVARGHRGLQLWGLAASLLVMLASVERGPARDWLDGVSHAALFTLLTTGGLLFALARPTPSTEAGTRMAWLLGGPLYAGGFLVHIANLHALPRGGHWVLLTMLLAWLGDTGAYFAGRFLGKHKLYPAVSPNKTIEGAVGGLLGSLTGALGMSLLALPTLTPLHAVLLTLIASPLGMCGDLFASLIKRSTDTKDSGWIVPGHGGLLDRVDALMFTAATTWLYYSWVLAPTS